MSGRSSEEDRKGQRNSQSAHADRPATRGAVLLVPPGDPEALRAALATLVGEGAARARLAEDCWQAAQGFTRWLETAAAVAAVLRGVAP